MKKVVICLLSISIFSLACDCVASKNMMKCDYYVGLKHDKTHQKDCVDFAKVREKGFVYGTAARYYLIGGDVDSAIKSAKQAVKMGENYAYEFLGLGYLLKNENEKAKKAFALLKVNKRDYMKKDIDIIKAMYKDFDKKKALKFLGLL